MYNEGMYLCLEILMKLCYVGVMIWWDVFYFFIFRYFNEVILGVKCKGKVI